MLWKRAAFAVLAGCMAVISAGAQSLGGYGPAQVATPGGDTTVKLPSTETLPRDYPVLTLHGICAATAGAAKPADCKTIITRAEFEKLVNALNPAMSKYERRQLADNYGHILTLSHEAIKRGLDKDPKVLERLRYTRLRILAGEMATDIYEEAMRTPDSEVARYYEEHKESFRRYWLQRIFVPKEKQGELAGKDPENGASELRALADQVRARAAAGEDFGKLQKEVTATSGITGEMDINLKDISRRGVPEAHKQVFTLDAGTVSPVITDETGYYVYRIASSEIPPLKEVRQLALTEIQASKQAKAFQKIEDATKPDVNAAYFDKYEPPAVKAPEVEVEEQD